MSEIEGWQPDLFEDVETDGWALMPDGSVCEWDERLRSVGGLHCDDPEDEDECPHEWSYTGSAYGGDDTRWHGEGRCYCVLCGADGDA